MKVMKSTMKLAGLALAALMIRSKLRSDLGSEEHKMNPTLLKLIYRPIWKWAARSALVGRNRSAHRPPDEPEKGRFTRAEVDRILEQAWRNYDELAPDIPPEPTLGSRMAVGLACFSLSFFRALMAAGVERDYAIELFADVMWKSYEKMSTLPLLIAKARTRDPAKRMEIAANVYMRFPFNPPGYRFEVLPDPDGIGIDWFRCPVAEYFQAYDAADICVRTWCNQDYGLGELWGGWFERTGTLAGGADHCDMQFKADGRRIGYFVAGEGH